MSLFDRSSGSGGGDGGGGDRSRPKLLSPDIFSFHDNGFLPLPGFFKASDAVRIFSAQHTKNYAGDFQLVFSDRREIHAWLDLLLQLSGASRQLDAILTSKRAEMRHVEQVLYPKIVQLQETNRRWRQLEAKLRQSTAQNEQMRRRGYTFLSADQANVIFGM